MSGKKKEISLEGTLLGALASTVAKTSKAPFERVKLLLQCQNEVVKQARLTENYKGIFNCQARIFKTEGVLSFWRGNLASCLSFIPRQAFVLFLNEDIKMLFQVNKADQYSKNFFKIIASGSLAGAIGLFSMYPFDYIRTRLAVDVKHEVNGYRFKNTRDAVAQTYAKTGVRGFYKGFLVSLSGVIVYRASYFGLYDTLRPIVLGATPHITASFAFGYTVVITSSLISYPLDTVRRRLMVASLETEKYKHAFNCFSQLAKNEGLRVFFKGFGVNLFTGIYGTCILIGFNSYIQPYFRTKASFDPSD